MRIKRGTQKQRISFAGACTRSDYRFKHTPSARNRRRSVADFESEIISNPGNVETFFLPRAAQFERTDQTRERTNIQAVLQWDEWSN